MARSVLQVYPHIWIAMTLEPENSTSRTRDIEIYGVPVLEALAD